MSVLTFEFDKAGFPLVKVEDVNAYVHWLPVTKIQFETFITDQPSPQFDEEWYKDILALNERISPKSASTNNYWELFITGVKPDEARAYAEWCGEEYRLPTLDEWNTIYRTLNSMPLENDPFQGLEIKDRPLDVLNNLEKVRKSLYRNRTPEPSLALQMFMRYGVMEWVQTEFRGQEWGGMGQSNSGLQGIMRPPEQGQPELPRNPLNNRLHYYGFRLLKAIS